MSKDSIARGSSNRWVALYKGLKVTVHSVDKPEISLTRQDLIELVNVRNFVNYLSFYHVSIEFESLLYINRIIILRNSLRSPHCLLIL